jgi:hypothetical protein
MGKFIGEGTSVRVTGPLVLDCGHFDITDPFDPCHEDDPGEANQEIHPVYAIDVVDATAQDLTGVWGDNQGKTYYVHHVGTDLWWFGMGPLHDDTFAQVFRGSLTGNRIDGFWQDVPFGSYDSGGPLTLTLDSSKLRLTPTGPLSDRRWIKLYDA